MSCHSEETTNPAKSLISIPEISIYGPNFTN
uniref:Uncharacterized protein n=1 Tax=Caenorhabditis japonica TaxID=281687 RepID=A0A8R1EV70_CAEJA